jgi:hypothetical protein
MGMQYDVFASAPVTSDGQLEDASGANVLSRLRIKTIYGTCGTDPGTVTLYDGGSNSSPVLITMEVPNDTAQGTYWLPMPGEGILAADGVYAELVNVASVMIIYG